MEGLVGDLRALRELPGLPFSCPPEELGKGSLLSPPVNGTWKRKQSWPLLTLLRGYRISNEASLKTGHLEPTVSSVFWLQRQVQHSVRVLGPWERQERGSKEMGICPYIITLLPLPS